MALTTAPVELVSLDGTVTINDSSADVDFRVESNGSQHMIFVDAGNDTVGINMSSPTSTAVMQVRASADKTIAFTDQVGETGNVITLQGQNDAADALVGIGLAGSSIVLERGPVTINDNSGDLDFRVESNSNSHMLFVDAGNDRVMVGKSSTGLANQGVEFEDGQIKGTATGQTVGFLNRASSDGTILDIRKDNSVVGTIGSNSSGGVPTFDISSNSSSGIIRLLASGSEAVRIDNLGSVGLKETSPDAHLHVTSPTATAGSGDMTTGSNINLILENSGSSGFPRVAMRAQSSSVAGVHNFETGKDVFWGETADTGIYYFRGRDLEVQQGNIVIGTSGKGIDFSATGDSSGTMSNELLDDYEEGTWTPVLVGSHSQSGQVYGTQIGTYTKIGQQVTCRFQIQLTSEGTFGNTYILLSGFPFALNGTPSAIHMGSLYFVNMGVSFISIGLQGYQGNTQAYLWAKKTATASREYVNPTDLSDTTTLTGTFTYFV